MRFNQERVRPAKMQQPEVGDHSFEALRTERQRLSVSDQIFRNPENASGVLNHRWREIDADSVRAELSRSCCGIAGPGAYVQQMRSRSDRCGLNQRPHSLASYRRDQIVIVGCGGFPSIMFKIAERALLV